MTDAPTPTVTLERYERNCPYNRNRIGPTIYDRRVMIDGTHRATFRREVFEAGYRLYDPLGGPIRVFDWEPPHLGGRIRVGTLAGLEDWVRDHLHLIPTADDVARRAARCRFLEGVLRSLAAGDYVVAYPGLPIPEELKSRIARLRDDEARCRAERRAIAAALDELVTDADRAAALEAAEAGWRAANGDVTRDEVRDVAVRIF